MLTDLFQPQEKNENLRCPEVLYLSVIGSLMYFINYT